MSGLSTEWAASTPVTTAPFPRHLVSADRLTRAHVETLFEQAEALRHAPRAETAQRWRGAVMGSLFYEPSTRTRMSFEAAALRLGLHVVGAENAREHSSAKKGERLSDTLRVVSSYVDLLVVRHHEDDALEAAAACSRVPVVSAGTGSGEHPTQALLDVYTLQREFGHVDGLRVSLFGDLRYGRTVHSLVRLLAKFRGVEVCMLAPAGLELPETLVREVRAAGITLWAADSLTEALADADVVYQTRVQAERLPADQRPTAGPVRIGPAELAQLPAHARILHPLPRVDELDPAIDTDPRAAYFRQVENGLFLRMAVLDRMLTETFGEGGMV